MAMTPPRRRPEQEDEERKKPSFIGAPACFALDLAAKAVLDAFPTSYGIYLVGSSLSRQDWRDVDLRMILPDDDFKREFPAAHDDGRWEHDPKWSLLMVAISGWLRAQTGLPVDFQIQPRTFANAKHNKPRLAIAMRLVPANVEEGQ